MNYDLLILKSLFLVGRFCTLLPSPPVLRCTPIVCDQLLIQCSFQYVHVRRFSKKRYRSSCDTSQPRRDLHIDSLCLISSLALSLLVANSLVGKVHPRRCAQSLVHVSCQDSSRKPIRYVPTATSSSPRLAAFLYYVLSSRFPL